MCGHIRVHVHVQHAPKAQSPNTCSNVLTKHPCACAGANARAQAQMRKQTGLSVPEADGVPPRCFIDQAFRPQLRERLLVARAPGGPCADVLLHECFAREPGVEPDDPPPISCLPLRTWLSTTRAQNARCKGGHTKAIINADVGFHGPGGLARRARNKQRQTNKQTTPKIKNKTGKQHN